MLGKSEKNLNFLQGRFKQDDFRESFLFFSSNPSFFSFNLKNERLNSAVL